MALSQIDSFGLNLTQWTTSTRPSSPFVGMTGYNTTTGAIESWHGATNGWITLTNFIPITATGGTTSDSTINGQQWRTHTFTSTGSNSFQITSLGVGDNILEVLMWGGGGSSAAVGSLHGGGGGGGAGAYFRVTTPLIQTYSLTVGAGGAGGATGNTNGQAGGSSVAFGITCGGGAGGISSANGTATAAGGTVSGTGVTFLASEAGQSTSNANSAGVVSGAAGGTNWSGAITAFGGGAGVAQGSGSGSVGGPGNVPGGAAASTYGSSVPSYAGGRGEIRIRYRIA